MHWYQLFGFALYLWAFVYTLNCIIARRIVRFRFKTAVIYTIALATLGVFGEVFVGSIYTILFGKPLWQYHVAPIHHNYTSLYAPVLWGTLGFYVGLLHDYLKERGIVRVLYLAPLFAIETLGLEIFANGSFHLFFGDYLFYYLPGDLWHLTSVQTLPFYLPAGIVFVLAMRRFLRDTGFFTVMCGFAGTVLVFLTH